MFDRLADAAEERDLERRVREAEDRHARITPLPEPFDLDRLGDLRRVMADALETCPRAIAALDAVDVDAVAAASGPRVGVRLGLVDGGKS
jgi:hypothetical protein